MPPKKKPHLNRTGIYYLAEEHRKHKLGYSHMPIQELIFSLLPRWRSMTLIEKKPYEDLAKQYKRTRMLNNEHAITPVIPSSEEASFLEQNNQEDRFLDVYLSADLPVIFKRDLLFVTFQIFCRTDDEDGGDYYPAEMAIMKYSFAERVKQEYFTIMKPETFPVGYTGTAIDLSRETHQIPPFDFIGANGNYAQIWQEVKRVIGDAIVESAATEPIIIFCNAFDRAQTTYLLQWLASKGVERSAASLFRVFSFEALVAALLRRLQIGAFAHQSVREQLRRPVYTLQVKERCIYHDSLAIQYCCRAINHGFSLFLDGFIGERFIQALPAHVQKQVIGTHQPQSQPTAAVVHEAHSIDEETAPSGIDSISSTFLERQRGLRRLTQPPKANEKKPTIETLQSIGSNVFIQSSANSPSSMTRSMRLLSLANKSTKLVKPRARSPIEVDCRWPIPSLYNNHNDDEDQYIMTGRGLRKTGTQPLTSNHGTPDVPVFIGGIGRGRHLNLTAPMPEFPM